MECKGRQTYCTTTAAANTPPPVVSVPIADLTEDKDVIEEDTEPPRYLRLLDEARSNATTETNPLVDASRRAG